MVTIYGLQDPGGGPIRYVGASTNPVRRLVGHGGDRTENRAKRAWLEGLKRHGQEPLIVVLESVEEVDAEASEARWIASLRRGGVLLNGKHAHTRRPIQKRPPRLASIPVRVNPVEERYLETGAESEPTGKPAVSTWLRGLGFARTKELTGLTFKEFEAREGKGKKG